MSPSRRTPVAIAATLALALAAGCSPADAGDASIATTSLGQLPNMPEDASGPGVPEGVAQFAVDPFWPAPLPNDWIIGQVAGVAVDADDNVWIIHRPWTVNGTNAGSTPPQTSRGNSWGHDPAQALCCVTAPPVLAFDPQGNVVQAWGGEPANGEYDWFNSEHGIHVDPDGYIWVAGNGTDDHHMLKFTRDGDFVLQIGGVGASQGSNDPASVRGAATMTVDPETNEIYVADGYGNRRLVVFDAETGEYRRHWGGYGETPVDENPGRWDPNAPASRTWRTPVHGVVISHDGLVYVADRPSNRIQVFQKDGTYEFESVLAPATYGPGAPWAVVLDPTDPEERFLYVPDGTNNKIWALDRATLEPVYSWGRGGRQPGQFDWVHYMSFDSQGNLYTGEVMTGHRVQKFVRLN